MLHNKNMLHNFFSSIGAIALFDKLIEKNEVKIVEVLGSRDIYLDNDYDDFSSLEVEKKEYSFQESKDRTELGVLYDASKEDIRIAYVELIKRYNPQKSLKNKERFEKIREAYQRLNETSY